MLHGQRLMKRLAVAGAVTAIVRLAPATVRAGPEEAPSTELPADMATPIEPGTLGAGQVGIRVGTGLGTGPIGLGAQVVVGLGGVDLVLGTSLVPPWCGYGGCDDAEVFVGGGVQTRLARDHRFTLGARAQYEAAVIGDRSSVLAAGVTAATGPRRWRGLFDIGALRWDEDGDPFGDNGWYVGGTVGLERLYRQAGVTASIGYGLPFDGPSDGMLLGTAMVFWR